MKALFCLFIISTLLTGCKIFHPEIAVLGDWNELRPPQEDALGHTFTARKNGIDIEDLAYSSLEGRVATSKIAGNITNEDNRKLQGRLDVAVSSIASLGAGLEYVSSDKLASSDWVVRSIKKPLEGARINYWFVHKCLMASTYSFEVKDKLGAGLSASLSEGLANKFGVDSASVRLGNNPESPDHLKIIIDNPNVCLAYRAMKYKAIGKGSVETITGTNSFSSKFVLMPGEVSNQRIPKLGSYTGPDSPKFFLRAGLVTGADASTKNTPALEICKVDRSVFEYFQSVKPIEAQKLPYSCRSLPRTVSNGWKFTHDIDIFEDAENNRVALIKLSIDALESAGGGVDILSASLTSTLIKKEYDPE